MNAMTGSEDTCRSEPTEGIRQDWTREAVALMQRDHERLRNHWQTLIAAIEGTGNRQAIRECLEALIAAAHEHFRNEEWALRVTGYTSVAAHAEDHKGLIRDAGDMLANLDLALRPGDWPALATYFRHWIRRHEDRHDRAFRRHIQEIEDRRGRPTSSSRAPVDVAADQRSVTMAAGD